MRISEGISEIGHGREGDASVGGASAEIDDDASDAIRSDM